MKTAIHEYHPEQADGISQLSVQEVKDQAQFIQELMQAVMRPDVHYGIIPGFGNKPSLYKPGAEKILTAFKIKVRPVVSDLSSDDEIRYRVITKGYCSGQFVGGGVGECSTNEEKFKWRKALCNEEWDATPEVRRRLRWIKDRNNNWKLTSIMQIRAEAADQANTVLKIAKKRAMIDLCLTATAASDLFTQDIEDLEPKHEMNGNGDSAGFQPHRDDAPIQMPRRIEQHHGDGPGFVVDVVSQIATKELDNGGTKYGIKTGQNGWFSTFKEEVAEIAEQAKILGMKVRIDYVEHGRFRNVDSISAA